MTRRLLVSSLMVLALAGCKGGASLPGHWVPESAMLAGKDFPVADFDGATLQLTENTYEFGGDKGEIVLPPKHTPAQMDINGREGPNAGKTIPAIYELKGDHLTVCYQLGGGERPATFESPKGTQVLLVHYKRMP
jgi:uncharacterized protein (TIGR03067 family)